MACGDGGRINSGATDTNALYREHGGLRRASNPRSPDPCRLPCRWSSREAGMRNLRERKGTSSQHWGVPKSWDDVIIQGPHLYVATPIYKSINSTMKDEQDWSLTDFEKVKADSIPATQYRPTGDRAKYDYAYTHWESGPARSYYRVAWRHGGEPWERANPNPSTHPSRSGARRFCFFSWTTR